MAINTTYEETAYTAAEKAKEYATQHADIVAFKAGNGENDFAEIMEKIVDAHKSLRADIAAKLAIPYSDGKAVAAKDDIHHIIRQATYRGNGLEPEQICIKQGHSTEFINYDKMGG